MKIAFVSRKTCVISEDKNKKIWITKSIEIKILKVGHLIIIGAQISIIFHSTILSYTIFTYTILLKKNILEHVTRNIL